MNVSKVLDKLNNVNFAEKIKAVQIKDELSIFNSLQNLNWAWIYETIEGHWQQLDCIQCMVLESRWQLWLKDSSIKCQLWIGIINFEKMTAEKQVEGDLKVFKILRTENKNRQRPNAE